MFACLLAYVVLDTVLARTLARRGVAPVAPPTSPGARAHYAVTPGGLHRRDAWLSILAAALALRALGARRRLAPEDGLRLLAALVLVRALVDPFVMPYYGLPLAFVLLAMAPRDMGAAAGPRRSSSARTSRA